MKPNEAKRFKKLYNKFIRAVTLQGKSKSTIDGYSRAVRRIAEFYDSCPDTRLTKEDLQHYFAELLSTHSWSTVKVHRNGLQQYWLHALNAKWDWVLIVKPPQVRSLPDILTQNEISRVFA